MPGVKAARRHPDFGAITAEQQLRMDQYEAGTLERRARAGYVALIERTASSNRDDEGDVVNCARCARLCDFNAERQGGYCRWQRCMVSTWHPAICRAFKAAA